MAKLDSLIVDLQLNTAELKKGLDEANQKLGDFGKKIDDLAGVITFEKIGRMAIDAGKGLANFAIHGAETIDKMGKMAESAGVSVESFSQLSYAANLTDISTEQLSTAMLALNQNITKASSGQVEQVALFRELGVSITDSNGKVRSADVVMSDLADAFAGMNDGAGKATLATDLFGKAGKQLIPLMNDGAKGLAAAADEADRFGATISSAAVAAASEFTDNMTRMKTALDVVSQGVAAQLAPTMSTLTNELLHTKDGANVLKGVIDALAFVLKSLVSIGVLVAGVFEAVGKVIARVASAVVNMIDGDFTAAKEDMSGLFSDIGDAGDTAGKRLKGIWADVGKATEDVAKENEEAAKKSAEAIAAAIERAKKAAAEYKTAFASLTKVAEDYESKVSAFGFGELGLLEARLNTGDLADQLAKLGDNAESMKQRILEAAQALNDLKIDLKMGDIKFEFGRSQTATQQNIADRRDDFRLAGMSDPNARRGMEMAGFKNFEAALSELAIQTDRNAKLLGDADLLRTQNDLEGARAATLAADEAGRAAAAAGKAADGFVDLAKETLQHQKEIMNIALGVLSSIGEKGSEVGALVNSAMQGFQAGGIWGAIIAVIANLFSKLESVGTFIDTVFGSFMEAFGQLNDSFSVLFTALSDSLGPVMKSLAMTFKVIGEILTPVFEALDTIMKPFIQLADALLELIEATGILDFVVKLVSGIFSIVGIVIGTLVLGIQYLWAGILQMVRGIIWLFTAGQGTKEIDATIAKHNKVIEANKKSIAKAADNIGKDPSSAAAPVTSTGDVTASGKVTVTGSLNLKDFNLADYGIGGDPVDVVDIRGDGWGYAAGSVLGAEAAKAFVEAAALMNGATAEAAAALGQAAYDDFLGLGDAAGAAADELNKFSASLTNVPTGFKYNLTKFNSTMGEGGEQFNRTDAMSIVVQGSILSEQALLTLIENLQSRRRFRQSGTSMTANYR